MSFAIPMTQWPDDSFTQSQCLREDSNPLRLGKSQVRCPLRHGGVSFRGLAFHLPLLPMPGSFGGATGTCTRNTTVRRSGDPVSPSPHDWPYCGGRTRTSNSCVTGRRDAFSPHRNTALHHLDRSARRTGTAADRDLGMMRIREAGIETYGGTAHLVSFRLWVRPCPDDEAPL